MGRGGGCCFVCMCVSSGSLKRDDFDPFSLVCPSANMFLFRLYSSSLFPRIQIEFLVQAVRSFSVTLLNPPQPCQCKILGHASSCAHFRIPAFTMEFINSGLFICVLQTESTLSQVLFLVSKWLQLQMRRWDFNLYAHRNPVSVQFYDGFNKNVHLRQGLCGN